MRRKPIGSTLCAIVLAAVSCNLSAEPPTASTTTSTTTTTPLTAEEAAVEFQSCLNDHGLAVPELLLDEAGRPDLSALADAVDLGSVESRQALTACASVIASSGTLDLSGHPELAEAVRLRLLAFSACMRSQGIEDFPDPPVDFDGDSLPYPLADIAVDDPSLGTVAEACALVVGTRPLP